MSFLLVQAKELVTGGKSVLTVTQLYILSLIYLFHDLTQEDGVCLASLCLFSFLSEYQEH